MLKIGIDTVDQFGGSFNSFEVADMNPMSLVDMVKSLHEELAVDVVEVNASVASIRPDMVTDETLKALGQYQAKSNVGYSIHLPFRGFDMGDLVEPMRDAAAKYQRDMIARFDEHMKVEHYVLHVQSPLTNSVKNNKVYSEDHKARILTALDGQVRKSLETILEVCDPKRLAIENLEMGYAMPYALAEEFDTGLCCDVGHLVIEGVDVAGTIKQYLDRIIHFHYHDVIEVEEDGVKSLKDHVALGTGLLDIPETLSVIVEGGFKGVLLVEVISREFARESMAVLRKHLDLLKS